MKSVKKFEMVPASMLLDKSVISAINFHCGDDDGDDGQFGKYSDGLLWIGTVTDDDGKEIHGLHLATAEYPEEGSTTLVEFDAPATDLAEVERLTAEREALQLLLNNRDDLDDQLTSLEQRRYAEQQAREAAERRVEELAGLLRQSDDFMYIMTGHDSHARLVHQYGKEWWTPVNELRGKICTALSNQSAPADKGHGGPVGVIVEFGFGLKEVSWTNGKMPDLGTKLYAERPAPVAVVMPEHRDSDLRSPVYGYARGWNACLDEVVRLNSEPKP